MEVDRRHELKPVIKELVRTQVMFPDVELLVDKMNIVKTSSRGNEHFGTYLVYLTDSEKSIQGTFTIGVFYSHLIWLRLYIEVAVFRRRMHKYVKNFDLREGSYIILKNYHLFSAQRKNGNGKVR